MRDGKVQFHAKMIFVVAGVCGDSGVGQRWSMAVHSSCTM